MSDERESPSLEQQVAELKAELEGTKQERDKAVRARDLLVREMLVPGRGTAAEPAGRGRMVVWLLAVVLLLGIGAMVVQMARTGRRVSEGVGTGQRLTALSGLSTPRKAPPVEAMSPRRLAVIPVVEVNVLSRVAVAPDGRRLALGGLDGKVAIRMLPGDRTLRVMQCHQGPVRDLVFTTAGGLVTAGADGAIHLWNPGSGVRRRTLRPAGSPVRRIAICGELLAVAAEQPIVELIPLGSKAGPARRLEGHRSWVRAAACTPDGARLATGGHDGAIIIWSVARGAVERKLPQQRLWVSALALSPDGNRLASGGFDRRIRLWDLQRGWLVRELRGHVRWISDLAFHPRGALLASAAMDRTARIWRVTNGLMRNELRGHQYGLHSVAFLQGGTGLLTASTDGTVRLWPLSMPTPRVVAPLPPPGPGEITLRSYTSGERVRVRVVDEAGGVLQSGLERLAWIMRSGPDDLASPPGPKLVKLLYKVASRFGRSREIWVVSGHRSPQYNELRTRQSRQVGRESRHMKGEALDFRIEGVPINVLHKHVRKLKAGGVGFYPDSNFIHMDIGPVRHWDGT